MQSITALYSSFMFYIKTGLHQSTASRVFRDLSNLYLTPSKPGVIQHPDLGQVEIITSLPWMHVRIAAFGYVINYYVDRQRLLVSRDGVEDDFPLTSPSASHILTLIKYFRDNGISIPRNNDGVKYVPVPGEEEFYVNN